jgi:regulator of protease activity HflC (stomatin/prohibitin superfamily)
MTLALALLWVAGFTRYIQGESLLTRILVFLLTIGSLALPVLWFLRPLEGPFAGAASFMWLLLWFLLFVRSREYIVGIILLLSLIASGAVFIGGLYIASGFLLPLPDRRHWSEIFNFLRDFTMKANFPAYVVVDELHEEDKVENRIPGNAFGEMTTAPGFVLTDCDHAVAISSGIKFKGVHGPGITFMRFGDQIVQTIDLRPQLRAFTVDALTKDGIQIKVLAFTPCKIDARGRKPTLGESLPYNKSAAFKAIHAQRTEHGGNQTTQRTWYNLPRMIAERTLQNIISEYNFDDLYGPYQPGGVPVRKIIAGRFYEQVAAELEPLGIQLIGGGISDLQPADPQVYVKRVRSWQVEWTRQITLKQAEGQAEWLRIVERARAEAQTDLIMSLGRQLEELSTMRTEFRSERVLEQAMIVLDQLTGRAIEKGALPAETLRGIAQIREAFTE